MDEAARLELERKVRERVHAGDHAAAATMAIKGYGPEIYGFLLAMHRNDDEAADVFSQFSENLWKGLPKFACNDEGLPLDCISWARSRAFCQSRGMDLSTEAQLQYAASGLAGHLCVWGDDEPTCDDAVFSRSPVVIPDARCPGESYEPPGRGRRDRLSLPTGEVVDLAGNLAETALDRYEMQGESCWRTGVVHDPLCDAPGARGGRTIVAGVFFGSSISLAAATRGGTVTDGDAGPSFFGVSERVGVGFRCARVNGR